MYSGRHDGFTYAATSIDERLLLRQADFYIKIITGYLNNDPLPFPAGTEESRFTNRLRFKRNVTLSDCVDDLREVALLFKGNYEFHHNGEPKWRDG